MEYKYRQKLHPLLLRGNFEDIDGGLKLALYHLKKSKFSETELKKIEEGLRQNIPVPHIIGYTLICDIPIIINRYVIHPGPETVILIEKTVRYIKAMNVKDVLDLCTGSGAIAVVVAKKCNVAVVGTDVSKQALKIAKRNASTNNTQVEFIQGNLFQPVRDRVFDVIVSNPPYVKTNEIDVLPRFVRDFAPKIAIDGGGDGLFFHRAILSQAKSFLRKYGCLFLECEDNQDVDILNLCQTYNWNIKEKYSNKHGNIRGFKLLP